MPAVQHTVDYLAKKATLKRFTEALNDSNINAPLIEAYLHETGFIKQDIYSREIELPTAIINNIGEDTEHVREFMLNLEERMPIGTVAVLLPKNGPGLTAAKAVFGSYFMGNHTIMKFPSKLANVSQVFMDLIKEHFPGDITIADQQQSSRSFLTACFLDPEVKAVVIYGDDNWIGEYHNLARRTNTKLIFEGPGNDPQVVFADADIDKAVDDAIACGLNNGGQSCSALERFFVHKDIHDEFVQNLYDKLTVLKVGNPEDPETELGPINSPIVLDRLKHQVEDAVKQGANLLIGGQIIDSGFRNMPIFKPAILTDCTPDMKIVKDENFGPVFPIIRFGNITSSLITMLDDSRYGLNASAHGTVPDSVKAYMESTHRNMYYNSTAISQENKPSRIVDGGFKRSGFVWEWQGSSYIQREGRRYLLKELSQPINK